MGEEIKHGWDAQEAFVEVLVSASRKFLEAAWIYQHNNTEKEGLTLLESVEVLRTDKRWIDVLEAAAARCEGEELGEKQNGRP